MIKDFMAVPTKAERDEEREVEYGFRAVHRAIEAFR